MVLTVRPVFLFAFYVRIRCFCPKCTRQERASRAFYTTAGEGYRFDEGYSEVRSRVVMIGFRERVKGKG